MINVVCGYSGSGKTTYAQENKKESDVLIDLDNLKEAFLKNDNINMLKELQLQIAIFFISRKVDIWYITCFPNIEELEFFENRANFIWINTSLQRSIDNIYTRKRKGDIEDIENIKKYNQSVSERYRRSRIKFNVVDIFETSERW